MLDDYIEDWFSLPPFSMDHGLLIRTCVDKPKEVILKCPLVLRHPVIFRLKFTFYVVYNNTKEESLVQISIYTLDPPQLSMIDWCKLSGRICRDPDFIFFTKSSRIDSLVLNWLETFRCRKLMDFPNELSSCSASKWHFDKVP